MKKMSVRWWTRDSKKVNGIKWVDHDYPRLHLEGSFQASVQEEEPKPNKQSCWVEVTVKNLGGRTAENSRQSTERRQLQRRGQKNVLRVQVFRWVGISTRKCLSRKDTKNNPPKIHELGIVHVISDQTENHHRRATCRVLRKILHQLWKKATWF